MDTSFIHNEPPFQISVFLEVCANLLSGFRIFYLIKIKQVESEKYLKNVNIFYFLVHI